MTVIYIGLLKVILEQELLINHRSLIFRYSYYEDYHQALEHPTKALSTGKYFITTMVLVKIWTINIRMHFELLVSFLRFQDHEISFDDNTV